MKVGEMIEDENEEGMKMENKFGESWTKSAKNGCMYGGEYGLVLVYDLLQVVFGMAEGVGQLQVRLTQALWWWWK